MSYSLSVRDPPRGLPHGAPELVERRFSLSYRHIRSVTQFKALLHQDSRRVTRRLRPASHLRWQDRAVVEMCSDALGRIRMTPRARMGENTDRIERRNLSQGELFAAANTLGDCVIATVDEQNSSLLGAEHTRPTTVEMAETAVAEDDSVLRGDHPIALRARRGLLFRH